jgi:hypothetical protein
MIVAATVVVVIVVVVVYYDTTIFLRSVLRLLVTANVVLSSPILVTLLIQAIYSFGTSFLTRAT